MINCPSLLTSLLQPTHNDELSNTSGGYAPTDPEGTTAPDQGSCNLTLLQLSWYPSTKTHLFTILAPKSWKKLPIEIREAEHLLDAFSNIQQMIIAFVLQVFGHEPTH